MYKWKIRNEELDVLNLVDDIYRSRGIENYEELFGLNEESFYDPYLLNDMQKSVDRIKIAIENHEKILVYGDYDVDGITSTFIVYNTLKNLGATISYDIPNRFVDGYGLSYAKSYDIINDGIKLVITVDNGIKSVNEVKLFKENNVDIIITDHHKSEGILPDAYAIIHTALSNYPFKPLAGVGVAFKLSQALIGDKAFEYSDIAALGTIADMMPLYDENRAIVNVGLKKLKDSSNIGLKSLISFLDINIPSVADVQYKIAPRINACGRMKSAKLAVQLLQSEDRATALKILSEVEELNNERKTLTKDLYFEVINMVEHDQPSIIVHSPKMHEGVIGIVAARLSNEYSKVSVVLKEDEFTYKGSIRSYNGVDVIYILNELKDILIRHGGHKNAAGLEFVKANLGEFKRRFNELIPMKEVDDSVTAEGIVDLNKLTIKQISELNKFDLRDCLFIFEDIKPNNCFLIKGEHSKIVINSTTEAIFFNNKDLYADLHKDNNVSLLGRLDVNHFRGRSKKQIIIDDYYINSKIT